MLLWPPSLPFSQLYSAPLSLSFHISGRISWEKTNQLIRTCPSILIPVLSLSSPCLTRGPSPSVGHPHITSELQQFNGEPHGVVASIKAEWTQSLAYPEDPCAWLHDRSSQLRKSL